jgi:hypothetical protein
LFKIKGQVLFKGEIIAKMGWGHLKIFFSRTFNQIWHKSSWDIQLCTKEENSPSPREDNTERVKIH